VPSPRLRELLPAPQHEYGGVRFGGSTAVAVDSFALGIGPLSWYGNAERDLVSVLGLNFATVGVPVPVASVDPVLRACDLVVVDRCRCVALEPDGLPDYLRAIGTT
jgi:hypothetical protein